MKFKNPWVSATERLLTKEAEHALYEKAANDIELDIINKGIWTKAFSLTEGDEKKQKAKYIELMVEHYKDLILAGEELEDILASEEEKREKAEAAKVAEEEKKKKAEAFAAEAKKKNDAYWKKLDTEKEKEEKWLQSDEGKKSRLQERIVLIACAVIIVFIVLLGFLANKFPTNLTYECGSDGDVEIVYIDNKDDFIHNITREKNAYNFSSNEEFKVYMLWNSPNGEGYMFNKYTNELGQLNPPEQCKFTGSKRHFKLSD